MPRLELPTLRIHDLSTIASAPGSKRPVLINREPAPGEANVPLTTTITLQVVDTELAGIARSATRVWIDGRLAFEGQSDLGAPEVLPGFDGPQAATAQDVDTLSIRLDPLAPFRSQAVVKIRVASATNDGQQLDETYTFTIEDRTAPQVVGAQATGPQLLRVGFDEPVQPPFGPLSDAFTLTPLDAPAVPLEVTHAEAAGQVLTLNLNTEMTPDVRYRLEARGVADLSGNVVSPPANEAVFVGFRPSRPNQRRFDLWSILPRHNRRVDVTGDLRRFIACLQEVTDLLLADVDRFSDIFDIERAQSPFIELILEDLGNPFTFDLNLQGKRRLAASLVSMYRQKGTAVGIKNAIRFFMGIEVVAIRPYASEALTLGESLLGVDWVLGPSNRFARYAFDVEIDQALSPAQHRHIRAIVDYAKPAHTHFVRLLEPNDEITLDEWVLNASQLGLETILS